MKTCTKCGVEKTEAEFTRKAASPDGLNAICVVCVKESNHKRQSWKPYSAANPKKRIAKAKANDAIKRGWIKREPCAVCRARNVEMHHEDYDDPYTVQFYCRLHHKGLHSLKFHGMTRVQATRFMRTHCVIRRSR